MRSIRHRVLFSLCLAGIVPLGIIIVITFTLTSRAIVQNEFDQADAMIDQLARKIESFLESAENDLSALATNPTIRSSDVSTEEKKTEFKRIVEHYSHFKDIVLYDTSGFFIVSKGDDENLTMARNLTSHWEAARNKKRSATPPQVPGIQPDPAYPTLEIHFYLPVIESQSGNVKYIIQARLDFGGVWSSLSGARLGKTGRFVLIDENDNLLYHEDKSRILSKFAENVGYENWLARPKGQFEDDYYARRPVQSPSGDVWLLLGLKKRYEAHFLIREAFNHTLMAATATILVALFLGFWLSKLLSDPVTELSNAVRLVAKGQLTSEIPAKGPVEMRHLARDFNQMASEIKKHHTKLESLVDERTKNLLESQERLADLTAQLRAAYESTQEAILVVKTDGEILAANRRFASMFAIPDTERINLERLSQHVKRCFDEANPFHHYWKQCNDSLSLVAEEELVVDHPKTLRVSVYSAPVKNQSGVSFARLWMFRDLTEQRTLEQGLRQAQKMEAIGRLAGGVAHDFNNLLTGIIGNLSLVEMEENVSDDQRKRLIASAKGAGQRAAELVKQLLGFSRQSHLRLEHCVVNTIVEEVRDLLVHSIDPGIQIKLDLADDLWAVNADPNQIEQVVMNMAVNAVDAVGKTGRICISTRNDALDDFHANLDNDAKPGDYVRISVEDTGAGMPDDIKGKIFEPFFTTKAQGKGTGLGLATSYGIIQQHGGWITCESAVGTGTTFHIFLPKSEVAEECRPASVASLSEPVQGGDETILLVDDDALVRTVGQKVLSHHGYKIILACDGEQALDRLDENEEIAVVLLDMTMPKLSGKETFGMMKKGLHAHIPVIMCSGYLVDLDQFLEETGSKPEDFVQKPYDSDDLVRMIRRILDEHARSSEIVEASDGKRLER